MKRRRCERKRVLVLGGGFAGLAAALKLLWVLKIGPPRNC
jgi:NADH dehydrogenase FAD-containing subunit